MKKLIWMLLLALTLTAFAAETPDPFAPYVLAVPQGAVLTENEGTHTFVDGHTRAVAIVIPRVPDADPAGALIRMMAQFEPAAVIGADLPVNPGFHGLTAVTPDKFGTGVDQLTVMILCDAGDLLILSVYDMDGDTAKAQSLLDALLAGITVNGQLLQPIPNS